MILKHSLSIRVFGFRGRSEALQTRRSRNYYKPSWYTSVWRLLYLPCVSKGFNNCSIQLTAMFIISPRDLISERRFLRDVPVHRRRVRFFWKRDVLRVWPTLVRCTVMYNNIYIYIIYPTNRVTKERKTQPVQRPGRSSETQVFCRFCRRRRRRLGRYVYHTRLLFTITVCSTRIN